MGLQHLGVNVRYYRQLLGLTQHGLVARAANAFSQSSLSRLESDPSPTDDQHIDTLATALEVSRDDLLHRPRIVREPSRLRPVVLRRLSPTPTEPTS